MSHLFSDEQKLLSNNDPQAILLAEAQSDAIVEDGVNWRDQFPEIIGRSHLMAKVLETVSKVAKASSPVLILGESGTGKELIAAAVHRLSPRCHNNFVAINCSAIPEDLLESELFGHEKGAFTGADKRRVGKFEAARGGTIFLDEIGDMSPRLQAKLLRVIQEMSLTPVGSNEQRKIDVRVIAATNIDLSTAIKKGEFRLDLFYRLNVLPIEVPSLKQRENDAVLILEHFLERHNRVQRLKEPCWLAPDAIKALGKYTWPGNIRQLQNVVERLVIMKGGGRIGIDDLPKEIVDATGQEINATNSKVQENATLPNLLQPTYNVLAENLQASQSRILQSFSLPESGIDLSNLVERIENKLILEALEKTNNNKQRAAKLLGLNRTTLVERIKKRKISIPNHSD
ncbi:MAG: sigma-54 dependent transcriptional regulator [Bdellovibrionota bacterium]